MSLLGSIGYFGQAKIHVGGSQKLAPPGTTQQSFSSALKPKYDSVVTNSARTVKKGSHKTDPSNPINLNTATQTDLQSLPGIGPSLSKRIVEYRQTNGPFHSVDDLRQVPGIGQKLFAKISRWLWL